MRGGQRAAAAAAAVWLLPETRGLFEAEEEERALIPSLRAEEEGRERDLPKAGGLPLMI